MPKKGAKKGGGGKLAGKTEEERLLYMQQRAQAEEEMARKKEEMLTQFLKDKLQKEEKNTAVNLHKLNQQWRAMLRQTRDAELRSDIAVLSQTFERVLDCKDSVIKCLVSDLKEAEQQSAQALRSHQQCVEQLLALQSGRLASLQQHWSSDLEELSSEFNSEREQILALHQQESAYLEDGTFALQQRSSKVDSEAQQEYQSSRDAIKHRSIKEKHALRMQTESKVESLRRQVQQVLSSYTEATDDRHIAFESLRARDQRNAQEIDAQMRKLQKMQDSISALRAKLSSSQRESEVAAQELRAKRDEVTLQTRQLKAQLSGARAAERSRLTKLTVQSDAAAKKLQGIAAKGEKILRLAEMCRKKESEREKVLPFYASSLTMEEQSQERLIATEPPSEELAKAILDYPDLERFWQRYHKVLLERQCLGRKKEVLKRENQQLQVLLRQHLDGISVSGETLSQPNSLLMVSQPTIATPAPADRQRRHRTVIEAAHITTT
uniref:dynein regulatory complex subunit 2-like n=1 Tax=Centroberyx gerrardi TaxID=166262 RepID=UPI003AAE4A1B